MVTVITNAILAIILTPLNFIINQLPTEPGLGLNTLATTITTSTFWPHLGWANDYFPLTEFAAYLAITLTVFAVAYLIRIFIWLWDTVKP